MIEDGKRIIIDKATKFISFGTPEEIEEYKRRKQIQIQKEIEELEENLKMQTHNKIEQIKNKLEPLKDEITNLVINKILGT